MKYYNLPMPSNFTESHLITLLRNTAQCHTTNRTFKNVHLKNDLWFSFFELIAAELPRIISNQQFLLWNFNKYHKKSFKLQQGTLFFFPNGNNFKVPLKVMGFSCNRSARSSCKLILITYISIYKKVFDQYTNVLHRDKYECSPLNNKILFFKTVTGISQPLNE